MDIEYVKNHIRNRPYMSGVDRTLQRKRDLQEFFTTDKILTSFDNLNPSYFKDPNQPFVDPCVGDGALLGEALIRKLENGIDFKTAIEHCMGCDIAIDNVLLTRQRLLCGSKDPELIAIVENNIIECDAILYNMKWDGKEPSVSKSTFSEFFD